ncbi:hypothetical protein [Parasediminibacterium sp. JCM 36343]|uniref:hypothetical protein n=1 Tax=Parasediminibacterium sp. JCM 36343 TaxID=3374279 RepID=UPI003978B04B
MKKEYFSSSNFAYKTSLLAVFSLASLRGFCESNKPKVDFNETEVGYWLSLHWSAVIIVIAVLIVGVILVNSGARRRTITTVTDSAGNVRKSISETEE